MLAVLGLVFCSKNSVAFSDDNIQTEEAIHFADANFENTVRKKINKSEGPILPSDVNSVTSLFLSTPPSELTGIEEFHQLSSLYISNASSLKSLIPLSGLTSLNLVDIRNAQNLDFSPLSKLTGLRHRITDLDHIDFKNGKKKAASNLHGCFFSG